MAVVFDAKTTTWTNSTVATMTVNNLTVGTGSNRAIAVLLICGSQAVSFPAGLTLTWDSGGTNQALTQISGTLAANGPSSAVAAVYGLLNPTSGNKNLVISWTGNNEMHASAASFTGVDQTSIAVAFPNGNSHSVSTAGASPCTVTVTSATGNMTIAGHAQSSFVWTTLSGTTIATDAVAGPNLGVASNFDNGAATVTLTAAWASGTTPNISVGCDILAAAAGGAAPFFQTDWPNPRPLRYFNSNIWQETGNSSLPIPLTPQGQPFSQELGRMGRSCDRPPSAVGEQPGADDSD